MHADPPRTAWRLLVIGFALWALAAAAYGTVWLMFGPRPVYVNVRWAPAVDAAARERLERRYRLAEGELREGRTWGYALTDRSRENIRAIVGDPAVEDTHQIHRTAFRVWYSAQRLPYRTPRAWVPVALEGLALFGLITGAVAMLLALSERTAVGVRWGPIAVLRHVFLEPRAASVRWARLLAAWIRGRIPVASAQAVAVFRVVFGSALLVFFLRRSVRGAWASEPSNAISDAHRWLLGIFTEAPWLADWIAPWLAAWGVLFIAGAWARTAFAMLTLGAFMWALLFTTQTTYHTVSALLVTLVCLLWSPWSDARRQGTPKEYGYTIWAPGLVLGVVYAAAAIAKLRDGGLAWILNGTVKYHFLSDSDQAMVDWGLQLGQYHAVAVLLSFAAIAVEALVIVGVLSGVYRYRLIAGVAALSLASGFSLLQGLFWPGWWILLLSFLPWHRVRAGEPSPAAKPDDEPSWSGRALLRPTPVAIVVALIGVQTVVSLFRIEVSPLLSAYDMYATTYASPAEYEERAGEAYWIVGTDSQARLHECRISAADVATIRAPASRDDAPADALLRRCFTPDDNVQSLSVEARRRRIDWEHWRPAEMIRTRLFSVTVRE